MHQFTPWSRGSGDLHGPEGVLEKIDIGGRALYAEVHGSRMKSGRYGIHGSRHVGKHTKAPPDAVSFSHASGSPLVTVIPLCAQDVGIDSHIDTTQRVLIDHADLSQRSTTATSISRLREGGVNAPFFALWVPTYYKGSEAVRRTLDLRDAMQGLFDAYPEQIALALTRRGCGADPASGKIAAILTIEGGHQIDDDLAVLRITIGWVSAP